MKLNGKFLAVQYETDGGKLKEIFRRGLKDPTQKQAAGIAANESAEDAEMDDEYDRLLTASPGRLKVYYLTRKVQEEAALVEFEKIDIEWFKQVPDGHYIYATGQHEFFRFTKINKDICAVAFVYSELEGLLRWNIFTFGLEAGPLPGDVGDHVVKFVQLLLYIELGETTIKRVNMSEKVKYGSKGDEKFFNDTSLNNIYLVNSNWNKIVIVEGDFKVRGHFRLQGVGAGRSEYKLVWVREYQKGSYVRRAGQMLAS